ncbi:MAG: cysteine methyltransferase [Candidatus Methanomethylicota archaeon]|nr:MAG: cysteine methyltransferase [Candidatus Verstraetearchaeota archaeon]
MVKALLLLIPPGRTVSYKVLADLLKISPRLIGRLMSLNDEPIIIPCHRVIRSDGRIGGYSLKGGAKFKVKLLLWEGVKIKSNRRIDEKYMLNMEEFMKAF